MHSHLKSGCACALNKLWVVCTQCAVCVHLVSLGCVHAPILYIFYYKHSPKIFRREVTPIEICICMSFYWSVWVKTVSSLSAYCSKKHCSCFLSITINVECYYGNFGLIVEWIRIYCKGHPSWSDQSKTIAGSLVL